MADNPDVAQRVVFVDSGVPDWQALVAGVKPGELVYVIAPSSDGLQQIADILSENHLTNLASISIVGHGASGAITLGSTTIDNADLSSDAASLAQIGTALAATGDLALYSCDTAAGAAGQQFIAELSTYADGVDVASATHLVGNAAQGGSWTLNAATGAPVTDVPFTGSTLANYQGTLGQTTAQAASAPTHFNGVNYVGDVYGSYAMANSLQDLAGVNVNAVALTADFGIDAQTSQVYDDDVAGGYTESDANIASTIKDATNLGLSVMVRPLIDFLPSNYETDPNQPNPKNGAYGAGDFRSYYNPSDPAAFFASYKTMIVDQAALAQANGAQLFSIGVELDQLTGPAYLSYWTDIISSVREVFSGKLTYSADWDDSLSPWQYGGSGLPAGTGNITTQISFWNQLDYVGIDEYAPISDVANPTVAQLVAGWTQTPTDPTTYAVTGNQSLISYYESISAALGKPLLFTELGYANSSDAASSPATPGYDENGNPDNAKADPSLQADLYKAYFQAWQEGGNGSLAGTYLWNWEPGGAGISNFSTQGLPAEAAVAAGYAACYCRGTRIMTGRGEVAVEDLAIGDRVLTLSGQTPAIKWIGRRGYGGRFIIGQAHLLPIRIKAGALADQIPRRDLWISPHHAMYLDGVLVEAKDLVNGVTVLQAQHVEQIEYFHIELDTHDVILAEGAWSETFMDDDSRGMFHNAREYQALYPEAASQSARYYAPRLETGLAVEAIRQKIANRFASGLKGSLSL